MYVLDGARHHRRLPPAAHASGVQDDAGRARRVRRPRLDGDRGPRHLLGRRPPQAPRVLRPPGRPAQPARRPRLGPARRAARPRPRARRLAVPAHPPRPPHALRARPARRSGRQRDRPLVRALRGRRPRRCLPARLGLRRHAARRPHRPAVGRRRARARPAPRDVLDQLAVPLLRPPALRDEGRVAQPLSGSSPLHVRRGVAQQPPRVPDVGRARHARAGSSIRRPGSSAALEKLGLAWDVVRDPAASARRRKLAAAA